MPQEFLTVLSIISTFLFLFLVADRLQKDGTSKQLKEKVINRYILYFMLYFIVFINIIFIDNNYSPSQNYSLNFLTIMRLSFAIVGVPIAMLRLSEPYVKQVFAETFCSSKLQQSMISQQRVRYSSDSLDSFLNSAMNIEFVYLIILGVDSCMDYLKLAIEKNPSYLRR